MVDHDGHAVIGVQAQELLGKLIAALDVNGGDFVVEATFLQQDGDLLAIGGGPIKNLDHPKLSLPPDQICCCECAARATRISQPWRRRSNAAASSAQRPQLRAHCVAIAREVHDAKTTKTPPC